MNDSQDPTVPPYEGAEDPALARARMVREQIARRGIKSPRVLAAMESAPRERFVPPRYEDLAHTDRALPIAHEQTISQPYIVALMTELSGAGPGARVLEVGTGSGYQTAVLAAVGAEVYTIEIVEPLAKATHRLFEQLGIQVHARIGDGHAGWPEAAPFDAIVVTAAPREVPPALKHQLAIGGRMVVPVGAAEEDQALFVIRRVGEDDFVEERVAPVRFVPMTRASFSETPGFDRL